MEVHRIHLTPPTLYELSVLALRKQIAQQADDLNDCIEGVKPTWPTVYEQAIYTNDETIHEMHIKRQRTS